MKRFLCKIDYETFTLSMNDEENTITLPMHAKPIHKLTVIISARTEIIHPVKLELDADTLIINKEIVQGVFISNAIVPKNGMSHIKILNTNNTEVILNDINLDTEPLENYDILKYQQKQTTRTFQNERFRTLKEKIKINCKDHQAKAK